MRNFHYLVFFNEIHEMQNTRTSSRKELSRVCKLLEAVKCFMFILKYVISSLHDSHNKNHEICNSQHYLVNDFLEVNTVSNFIVFLFFKQNKKKENKSCSLLSVDILFVAHHVLCVSMSRFLFWVVKNLLKNTEV